jgi:two-component system, LuxR family, response regulator FixJ
MIFIVDDDDAVRDSLRLLLEAHGMTVQDFDSTADFAEAYRPHPRACLILDLHLPVMGGLDFLASRGKEGLELPVIMVTGRGDDASRARALELGARAFLEKPVDDRELLSAIERALSP